MRNPKGHRDELTLAFDLHFKLRLGQIQFKKFRFNETEIHTSMQNYKKLIINTIIFTFFLTGLICFVSNSQANTIYGEYGVPSHKTISDYKKYIGKSVIYYSQLGYRRAKHGETFIGQPNTEYIIEKVSGSTKRLNLHLVEKNSKRKARMDVRQHVTGVGYQSIPLILLEEFDTQREAEIGKKFRDQKSGSVYECIDVFVKFENDITNKSYPKIYYLLNDNVKKQLIEVPILEKKSGKHFVVLNQVIKPLNEQLRYGKTKVINTDSIIKYTYADDFIDLMIYSDGHRFFFKLENTSNNSIKVVWNEGVFVDVFGESSKIAYEKTFLDKNDVDQKPFLLISGTWINGAIIPIEKRKRVKHLNEYIWLVDSLFPIEPTHSPRQLKLMLPIQINETINEYIFVFDIEWEYNYPVEETG